MRKEILKQYPELEEVLYQLDGMIDEENMQIMNGKVDNDGMVVEVVAREFLEQSGLIEKENDYKSPSQFCEKGFLYE